MTVRTYHLPPSDEGGGTAAAVTEGEITKANDKPQSLYNRNLISHECNYILIVDSKLFLLLIFLSLSQNLRFCQPPRHRGPRVRGTPSAVR